MELIRLTAIDSQANMLIDELVFPSHMVIDLNTRYSGIKTLAGAKHNLESIRQELFKYINADTILLGHGLVRAFVFISNPLLLIVSSISHI